MRDDTIEQESYYEAVPMLEDDRLRRRKPAPRKKQTNPYSGLIGALMGIIGLVVVWTLLIVLNPGSPLNPFAFTPPTPTLWQWPTATSTIATLPPTWTPSAMPTDSPFTAEAVLPTTTVEATVPGVIIVTPTPIQPTAEVTATLSIFAFTLDGEVDYARNENGEGCAWMSIAGQVLDVDGNPMTGVFINVVGESFEWIEWAGTAPRFGESGFEVFLNTSPYVANWSVQLIHSNTMPLSDKVTVRSSADCNRNVVIVNFKQNHEY